MSRTRVHISAEQRRRHADQIAALTGLRDQILATGYPMIPVGHSESVELIDDLQFDMARLIICYGDGTWLLIDATEPGRYSIDKSEPTTSGRSQTTAARDVDDAGALRVFGRFFDRCGLPEREVYPR